jgi:uncharacterized phage protein gp47/JayE
MTTNVPLPVFTPAGVAINSEQAILQGMVADFVAAFALQGKTLTPALTAPQGQLASSQAFIVADFQALLAQIVAMVDPMTSSGAYQDALGRIYFLTRKAATFATVPATLGGVPGQPIPAGGQVKSGDGTIWATLLPTGFAPDGTAPVIFQSLTAGSLPVAGINDLTIYQRSPGWQTVTNVVGSTPGRDVESRSEFETRRQESVQIGGTGAAAVVRAAVADVAGVSDVFVYNNGSDTAITYGTTNYPIPAHSIAIMATGGADLDIANAIHSKLDAGAGMSTSEATTVTITDSVNYAAPYPQYPINFVRPTATQVYITVNVAALSTLPSDYIVAVQQAVALAFLNGFSAADGSINIGRARIGGQILAAGFSATIQALGNITPVTIYIGFTPMPVTGNSVTMGIDQQPVCPQLNITVNAIAP